MPRRRIHLLCLTASTAALSLALTSCGDGSEAQPSEITTSESPMTDAGGAETTNAADAEGAATASAPGEYVPASADGPAQNVPVPEKPPLADEESYEGAQAFLDYLSDARAYAWETGDMDLARDITAEECTACHDEYDRMEDLYEKGGWSTGGRENLIIIDSDLPLDSYGFYAPRVEIDFEGIELWNSDGSLAQEEPSDFENDSPVVFHLDHYDGEWVYILPSTEPS